MNKKQIFIYKDDMTYFALDIMERREKLISFLIALSKLSKKVVEILHISYHWEKNIYVKKIF